MRIATDTAPVIACIACLPLTALSPRADAAGEVVPEIRITADTNDNPRLRPDAATTESSQAASRLMAQAGVRITSFRPQADFEFEPVVRTDAYGSAANDELESTDVFLRGRWQRRWQRAVLGFDADASREKLLGAEVLDTPPGAADTAVDVDGALLGLNEIRTRGVFSPYTRVQLNERSGLRFDLRATATAYDASIPETNRTDFTNWEAGAAYVRNLTPRTTLSTRLFGGQYLADANDNTTDTTGLEMEFARDVSDLWSFHATWGAEQSDFRYVDATSGINLRGSHDDLILGVGVRKQAERSSLALDVRKRVFPDSFGFLVARNELQLSLHRNLSEKVRGGVVVRAANSDALADSTAGTRRYGRLELELDWAFAELWSLVAGYEHSYWRNAALEEGGARSNSVLVGFSYRGRSRRPQP